MGSASDLTGSQKAQSKRLKTTFDSHPDEVGIPGVVMPRSFPGLPAHWVTDCESFSSRNKYGRRPRLFAVCHHQEWTAVQKKTRPVRVLFVVHGLGEHGGRYIHLPHYLQSELDGVYCLDQRGHGRSEGLRGHLVRFDDLADDVAYAVRRLSADLKKRFGFVPEMHLLGHSLGGHVVLRTAFLHDDLPISSVIASAPFLGIKTKVPFVKRLAAGTLASFWGSLQLSTALNPDYLSHDRDVVSAYLADRLVHDKMTPLFFKVMTEAMVDTLSRDSGFKYPLQMLVPLEDQLVDPEVTLEFFQALQHKDKHLSTFEGFYHEVMNEIGKEEVFKTFRSWLRRFREE